MVHKQTIHYCRNCPILLQKPHWDHYITIALKDALGIENDAEGRTQLVNLTANGKTMAVAALVQPGQTPGTLGIALGYGRTKVGKVGENIGVNVYPLLSTGETIGFTVIVA